MKANTSTDLLSAYFANGGRVNRVAGQKKPPKSLSLRSGNHHYVRHVEVKSGVPPMPPRPAKPVVTRESAMTNTAIVAAHGLNPSLGQEVQGLHHRPGPRQGSLKILHGGG